LTEKSAITATSTEIDSSLAEAVDYMPTPQSTRPSHCNP
jgi:hypothetical protein